MPMIDVYAATGTFADEHQLAVDLASAVMKVEVPDIPLFRTNTAAFIRIQVLTNAGALDRDKQLAGHANTNRELVQAARAQLATGSTQTGN